jgi:hypothetical protein
MSMALIDIALTNASMCYLLENPELKKKEGHHRWFFEEIASFLIAQGEMFDWEDRLGSQNNDVDVYTIVMRKVLKMKNLMMCCCMISEYSVQCRTQSEMH